MTSRLGRIRINALPYHRGIRHAGKSGETLVSGFARDGGRTEAGCQPRCLPSRTIMPNWPSRPPPCHPANAGTRWLPRLPCTQLPPASPRYSRRADRDVARTEGLRAGAAGHEATGTVVRAGCLTPPKAKTQRVPALGLLNQPKTSGREEVGLPVEIVLDVASVNAPRCGSVTAHSSCGVPIGMA